MALVKKTTGSYFDTEEIGKGWLIWAKHSTWDEGKSGFVSAVNENAITVQYHPGIGNVTNHFVIRASEAADGGWEIRYSEDLTNVESYPDEEEADDDV